MTKLALPKSVTHIDTLAFDGCTGLEKITVESENSCYDSRDNCNSIIETETNTLIIGCKNSIIPNSVTSIGKYAFYGCSGLTELTLPNSVTSIGEYAFDGAGLEKITVESENSCYDSRDNCNSIIETETNTLIIGCKNSIIPNSVTSIGKYAFHNCTGLAKLTLPNSLESIDDRAFEGCSGLTELTLPNSVTSIGEYAFDGAGLEKITVESENSCYDSRDNCNSIIETETNTLIIGCKNSIIPNSVTSIGKYAFHNCTGLAKLTLPNSLESIDDRAFEGCSGLTELTLPNSVTIIGDGAFQGCSGLTELTLPNYVRVVEACAFKDCSGLTKLTLPNILINIWESAFSGCSGLTELTLPSSVWSIGNSAFEGCSGLTELTLPNSVMSIGRSAFGGCSGLTELTLPNSVTSIGGYAFAYCSGLSKITSLAEIPPVCGYGVFDGVNKTNCELIVPKGSVAAYKQAYGWNGFSNIRGFVGEKK